MMSQIERRLEELGLTLPEVTQSSAANHFVPVMIHNGVAYVSGQVPRIDGKVPYPGKVGTDVTIEQAGELAEYCVLQGLSYVKGAIGTLDHIEQVLKVTGYVQAAPGNDGYSQTLNPASELLVKIFGNKGRHARAAIGVAELPNNTPIEIDFIIAVKDK